MTAPALIEGRPRCHPGIHTHEQPPTGGRCGYWSPGRPGNICGRPSVAAYIRQPQGIAWRCATHDKEVAQAEAARLGFVRQAVRP